MENWRIQNCTRCTRNTRIKYPQCNVVRDCCTDVRGNPSWFGKWKPNKNFPRPLNIATCALIPASDTCLRVFCKFSWKFLINTRNIRVLVAIFRQFKHRRVCLNISRYSFLRRNFESFSTYSANNVIANDAHERVISRNNSFATSCHPR